MTMFNNIIHTQKNTNRTLETNPTSTDYSFSTTTTQLFQKLNGELPLVFKFSLLMVTIWYVVQKELYQEAIISRSVYLRNDYYIYIN